MLFVTLHVVGTSNGRSQILLDERERAIQAVDARDAANLEWLEHAVERSRDPKVGALVIAMHADMFGKPDSESDSFERCAARSSHRQYCRRIVELAQQLGKPILLLHGDTSPYCMDRPFGDRAPRVWRLNAPGDGAVIDASIVSVDPADIEQPFVVTSVVSGEAPRRCPG